MTLSYRDALQAIWDRSDYDRGFISNPFAGDDAADLGLRRTAALLDALGRPQDRYGIVHVAGSKGKGSTSVVIDKILTAAGYRVGRYTQPHLHSWRERITVGGEPISETDFAALITRGLAATEAIEAARPELGRLTAFEMTTALALAHLADAGCDLGVIEVGLGGTLDATNVVQPLVSVITTLDLEHTAVLGETLPEIAAQKAGIIKPGRPVAASSQPADARAVIERIAAEQGSPLISGDRDWLWLGTWQSFTANGPWGIYTDLHAGLIGAHQVENACTAIAATWLLNGQTLPASALAIVITEVAVRTGIAGATWPGRFEIVSSQGVEIVFDGAHTPASARALATALAQTGRGPATFVIGMLGDKDAQTFGRALANVCDRFIVTMPKSPRAASIDALTAAFADFACPVETAPDVASAIERAVQASPVAVVVTGSLTTVAEARQALGLAEVDPPLSTI